MNDTADRHPDLPASGPSGALITVLAVATGALVANLYYAQPLVRSIGPAIGIDPALTGSIVGVTQIGYGVGLFFLVSLADLVDNKRLVLTLLALTTCGLLGVGFATGGTVFFLASVTVGVCSVGAQILLPFTAHLVPVERRGRVVGNVMAGVLTGIMLARPLSLFIASVLGWRAVFLFSAGLMVLIAASLAATMPSYRPPGGMHYGQVIGSMARLVRARPAVLWRAAYQALMFAAFNLFWTAAPVMLADHFGLNERAVALFALAGAGGAFSAPIAGRLADRGLGTVATAVAMALLGLCFAATIPATQAGLLAALVVLAVIIDAAVQINQVVSQRTIYAVPPEIRGRVNAVYMTISFLGGALGSMLSTVTYHRGGWTLTAVLGTLIGGANLVLLATERARLRAGGVPASDGSSRAGTSV
jgi:predicted MFS family arabinose efflux permease